MKNILNKRKRLLERKYNLDNNLRDLRKEQKSINKELESLDNYILFEDVI